jgi:hypothetical protein
LSGAKAKDRILQGMFGTSMAGKRGCQWTEAAMSRMKETVGCLWLQIELAHGRRDLYFGTASSSIGLSGTLGVTCGLDGVRRKRGSLTDDEAGLSYRDH